MQVQESVNILVVDDQPAKLLTYEAALSDLGENLIMASSGREALECLLRTEIAVVLVDVCMPELDGFQLAEMIRGHPRFTQTAIVFVSGVQLDDLDRLRGYRLGAVDYVPIPIIPELLRAKVRVFAELFRKTRQLELLNRNLEERVAEQTAALRAANLQLTAAVDIARLGTWQWRPGTEEISWSDRCCELLGYRPGQIDPSIDAWRCRLHPEDAGSAWQALEHSICSGTPYN